MPARSEPWALWHLLGSALAAACASPAGATKAGPEAQVPVFAAGDARVGTAGFVAETLRLHHERDGVRYTLMAFVVGDTLTLGAMVRGKFAGEVRWRIGDRRLSFAFDTDAAARDVPVSERDAGTQLRGQGASFRGTSWVNLDLPLAGWAADGTPLELTFVPRAGAALALPDGGYHYTMRLVPR